MRNNMFEEGSARPSRSFSLPSFSLLGRNNSEQSNSLSKSSSLDSVRTDSTISSEAELLNPANHKEVKAPSSFWDKVSSPFKSGKKSGKTSEVEYRALESGAMPPTTLNLNCLGRSSSSSCLTTELTLVATPKVPESSSIDSGFNSPTSSPTHTMFTNEDGKAKTQADLKETGYLNKLVGQPSTKVAVDTDVQQQAAQTAVKTN